MAAGIGAGLGSVVLVGLVVLLWVVMPDMRARAILLFAFALGMQLAGAVLVILDVWQTIRNTRRLKMDLAAAEGAVQEHHRSMIEGPPLARALHQAMGQDADRALRQMGPAGQMERQALVRHLNAQSEISDFRRWGGVAILVLGVVVGFVANVVALYA
ncbi:hypothetical protein KEK_09537 [Mycolicibacterium thermoresistibile ATCC 19527]|uniref:Transmembrane protein n=1 Tax=Mycolicibacterium thermoresistibile (strain ATCC 19527 / DSM 44167 / CIP 105390 / JCM 6362 / NCTC 10409 / 316) TaxID=1078020 RepID=G7CFY6_MYCT3|nr:hypothetical protein KEK_09537 [Mycolicibacterium thermoresistibile ATCC 19527]SNW18705.1 Uncharacterised protein [Mycolicibacterium thermoresistibile]